ncbi:TetR/AcrR family transcriptional regulator [Nocardioides caldifontis]|uniref:TetR/AcrR family transcriptional regulator n=1 Tax=Nocardioides caldifontis TaxID=2588938 RepID=UPI001396A279|nr:TetR/AcrR family transcriptional regulator [Nocardioides caldifontis]
MAERRGLLVDAAIRVMAREGVPNTTTRMIVAEAGMQIGVFHYCFRSKEELVLEVMKTITDRNFDAVGSAIRDASQPSEMIALALDAYWTHVQRAPMEHLVTYELTQHALRRPGGEADARAQYRSYTDGMEAFLTAAAATGGFSWRAPVPMLARYVLAVIEGVTFQWLVNRDDDAASAVLHELREHLHRMADLPRDRAELAEDANG